MRQPRLGRPRRRTAQSVAIPVYNMRGNVWGNSPRGACQGSSCALGVVRTGDNFPLGLFRYPHTKVKNLTMYATHAEVPNGLMQITPKSKKGAFVLGSVEAQT